MKIGIFGGSFSPPHLGHERAAKLFCKYASLDRLIVMPAGIPPHKELNAGANHKQRLEMCRIAFGQIAKVSDFEIKKSGASYTVETLRYLKDQLPKEDLFLFMGEDMFLSFDRWYCPAEITSLATLCCMRRCEGSDEEFCAALEAFRKEYNKEPIYFTEEPFEVSSSWIRTMIKEGKDVTSLLSEGVYNYIKENNLYNE